jgi:homoserine kinase
MESVPVCSGMNSDGSCAVAAIAWVQTSAAATATVNMILVLITAPVHLDDPAPS